MALQWVLLSLPLSTAVWLTVGAGRESKRLHERLCQVELHRRSGSDTAFSAPEHPAGVGQ
jgi:hypothetical protein